MNILKGLSARISLEDPDADRRAGDAARDGGRWDEAIRAYRRYLAATPEDADIWVQLGHASKEVGELADARDAYDRAVLIDRDHADAHLHRAHLLKRMDRPRQAEMAFLELMRLAPTQEVVSELAALRHPLAEAPHRAARAASPVASRRCLEIGDLLGELERHATPTGISRVVLALVDHLVERMDEDEAAAYHFVLQSEGGDGLFQVSKTHVRQIVEAVTAARRDGARVGTLIAEARRTARLLDLGPGDLYFIPGAFWAICQNPKFLQRLKGDGVLIGAYVYDLIPITNARYCEASLTQSFSVALAETAPFLDVCFTISAFVAAEVAAFFEARRLPPVPIRPVTLAHEMKRDGSPEPRRPSHRDVPGLGQRPFVLCVCTIEARKNHAYLLGIWHRMMDEGLDVPDLVFVGRVGWRVADLMAQVEASNFLDGRLIIMSGASDAELSSLYERCLFTVFPSFVEGWGLPVGESLSHGKPCAASATSSIPEVGGDLLDYFDPFNQGDGYRVIRRLLTDPAHREAREAAIRARFRPRRWSDVGQDFFGALDDVLAKLPAPAEATVERETPAPRLAAGSLLTMERLFGSLMSHPDYLGNPLRLIFHDGWRRVEQTGTWLDGPAARLRFRTDYDEGREVVVALRVSTSPWVGPLNLFHVWASAETPPRSARRDGDVYALRPLARAAVSWIKLRGRVGAGGRITVQFRVEGDVVAEGNNLPVAVRLHAVGYAASDDLAARLELIESREAAA